MSNRDCIEKKYWYFSSFGETDETFPICEKHLTFHIDLLSEPNIERSNQTPGDMVHSFFSLFELYL